MNDTLTPRGAFSYVKRVTQKLGKTEYAAKFVSARAKKKASALREMKLLSRLDHDRVLYFHDAFEKKNAVVIVTELYPCDAVGGVRMALRFDVGVMNLDGASEDATRRCWTGSSGNPQSQSQT